MKKLYFWNDLSIFEKRNLNNIDLIVRETLDRLHINDKCKYYYISQLDFAGWVDKLNKKRFNDVITLGTRPNLISLDNINKKINLTFKRLFNNDGKTVDVKFIGHSNILTTDGLMGKNVINVIEDVMVEGRTIETFLRMLSDNNFSGEINFFIFLANRSSINKLTINCRLKANFYVEQYMEGEPISESSCLCIHDLMFGKLGERYYRECVDLLEKFFYENTKDIIECIELCRNIYSQYLNEK